MYTPFQQGRAARLAGKPLAANPHQPHDQAYNDWHDGWTSKPNPAYCVYDGLERHVLAAGMTYDEALRLGEAANRQNEICHVPGGERFVTLRDFT